VRVDHGASFDVCFRGLFTHASSVLRLSVCSFG
jgi:hypothetical protein